MCEIDAESDVPYFILSDQEFQERKPDFLFRVGHGVPHYGYTRGAKSSLRRMRPAVSRSEPFKFKAIDPGKLTKDTVVKLVEVKNAHFNYLRDIYLSAGMQHVNGTLQYLIFLDGMLLGGVAYEKPHRNIPGYNNWKTTHTLTQVMSDFCITPACRLSKLVAMVSKSRTLVGELDRRLLRRTDMLATTAFTNNPVSMKYRGVFKLLNRGECKDPGLNVAYRLSYAAPPSDETPQAIYNTWWKKHGEKEVQRYRD